MGQSRHSESLHQAKQVPYPSSSFATHTPLARGANLQPVPKHQQFPTVPNMRALHQINLDAPIHGMSRPQYQPHQSSLQEMYKRPQSDVMSNDMFGDAYLENKELDASKPPVIKSP
mmetsp:Transcript_9383/g.14292  ORF Transcript_9383/g.14292 Transcript_9383/m.14292 type:complete len:116 (+) Transcript_9383:2026-2373(+)